jgi:hypothetical protein
MNCTEEKVKKKYQNESEAPGERRKAKGGKAETDQRGATVQAFFCSNAVATVAARG